MARGIGSQTVKSSYDQLLITENMSGLQPATYTQIHSGEGTVSCPMWLHEGSLRLFTEDSDGLNIFKVMALPSQFDDPPAPIFRIDAGTTQKGVYIENCNLDITSTAAKVSLGSGTTGNGYGYMLRGDNNFKLSWQTFLDAQGSYITLGDATSNIYATTLSLSTIPGGEATFKVDNIEHNKNANVLIGDAIFGGTAGTTSLTLTDAFSGTSATLSSLLVVHGTAAFASTVAVTGALTLYGGMAAEGFTVANTTGNTAIGGTLGVTGATTMAALTATSASFSDGNITNVGDIDVDSISSDDLIAGLQVSFDGNTGTNKILLRDDSDEALTIEESGRDYIKFITTNDLESIVFGQDSTFASTTIANLGTVTTAIINGGAITGPTINNSIIGGSTPAAGTFTALAATSGDFSDNDITNVGNIDLDSISVADDTSGLIIDGSGANTTLFKVMLRDNMADALNILEDTNSYMKFITTNDSEQIVFGKNSTFLDTTIASLGTVATADINGGTIDGTTIGNSVIADGTFNTLIATTFQTDTLSSKSADTDLSLSGTGSGIVKVNDKLDSTVDITASKIGVGGPDEDDTLDAEIVVGDIAGTDPEIHIVWKDAGDVDSSGKLIFFRDESPGASGQVAGEIYFTADNSASAQKTIGKIETTMTDYIAGSEAGKVEITAIDGGANNAQLILQGVKDNPNTFTIGNASQVDTTMKGDLTIEGTLQVDTTSLFTGIPVFSDHIKLTATKKFYLDGGGDTYLHEVSPNKVQLVCGDEVINIADSNGGVGNTLYGEGAGANLDAGTQHSVFVGYQSGYAALSAALRNTAVGAQALYSLTTGYQNTTIGRFAGGFLTTGSSNTVVGYQALGATESIETSHCVAIGSSALAYNTGNYNIGVGKQALHGGSGDPVTGNNNIAIGYKSGYALSEGIHNTFVGDETAMSASDVSACVFIGSSAGQYVATGSSNTFVGNQAGNGVEGSGLTGAYNVAMGYQAGYLLQVAAEENTFIGTYAGKTTTTGVENTCIGYNCLAEDATAENQIVIGNNVTGVADNAVHIGNDTRHIRCDFGSDQTWDAPSDERIKNITGDSPLGLDFINALPVKIFTWKPLSEYPEEFNAYNPAQTEPSDTLEHHGLIAQTVKKALDEAGVVDFSGWDEDSDGMQTVGESAFVYPLIKAVQELTARIEALEA